MNFLIGSSHVKLRSSGAGHVQSRLSRVGCVQLRSSGSGRVQLRSSRVGRVQSRSSRVGCVQLRLSGSGRVQLRSSGSGRVHEPAVFNCAPQEPAVLVVSRCESRWWRCVPMLCLHYVICFVTSERKRPGGCTSHSITESTSLHSRRLGNTSPSTWPPDVEFASATHTSSPRCS